MKKKVIVSISLFTTLFLNTAQQPKNPDFLEKPQLTSVTLALSTTLSAFKSPESLGAQPWDRLSDCYPALSSFIQDHQLARDKHHALQLYLEDNLSIVNKKTSPIPLLNLYYKGNIWSGFDRVINAERARICIKEENLDALEVPRKYIIHFKGQYHIFAECSDGKPLFKNTHSSEIVCYLTPEILRQLFTFCRLLSFHDWCGRSGPNIFYKIQNEQMKLIILDTEIRSFGYDYNFTHINNFLRVLAINPHTFLPETHTYIKNKIALARKDKSRGGECIPKGKKNLF